MSEITCFKAYDIRGEIGLSIDENIAYRIGRAVAQHFSAKSIVIGFDARQTSPAFAAAASQGARDAGADVVNIGMAGIGAKNAKQREFLSKQVNMQRASNNPFGLTQEQIRPVFNF